MKIALAQINPVVGDLAGNVAKHLRCIGQAREQGAELVVFGELSLMGYPPRDLLSRPEFIEASARAVAEVAKACTDVAALVGFARPADGSPGRPLENAAALLAGGAVAAVQAKTLLPSYDVFDETRYFRRGPKIHPLSLRGRPLGVTICEDLWDQPALGRSLYETDPVAALKQAGAEVIVNMSASPFTRGKVRTRQELIVRQARRAGVPIVYVNQVGGNDELIFDGASLAVAADGALLGRCRMFEEDLLVIDTAASASRSEDWPEDAELLAQALVLGIRDYAHKCGFTSAVLGLSGGIDSAVVATLAADALGSENVLGLAMPSRYSSDHSLSDAYALAQNLGIRLEQAGIEPMHAAFEAALHGNIPDATADITFQNIQARVRGCLVMAYSNGLGHLPLATGNKSEMATGYCTLYGDMDGGLAPIGDVLKTQVYQLARTLNSSGVRIPEGSLTKPPSAELKPDQTDQDRLPPYDVLDAILERYIECEQSAAEIVAQGFEAALVQRVVRMVTFSEYKRRQAAPVLKVSPRAFGPGRRLPIACKLTGL